MKDVLIIGIFGFIAYEILTSHGPIGPPPVGNAAPLPAGNTAPLQSGPLMHPPAQTPQGIAIGEPYPGSGGGGGGTQGAAPLRVAPPLYDPFATPFFDGGGDPGPTYRQQYPLPPGVIDGSGGGDSVDIYDDE